jgi:hypothetical protein
MRWRVALAAAVATLLLTASAPAQIPQLAQINHISGDRSGYLDVRIPTSVRMSFDARPDRNGTFAIRSTGFAAVMLRRLNVDDGLHTLIAAARFDPGMLCGGCEAPIEALTVDIEGVETQASTDYAWKVPAGDYRLYLLTDGRPADVRITLPERDGSRVLHPVHGVENPVPEGIPPLLGGSGAFQTFARGDQLASRGAQLWGALVYVTTNGSVEIEGCSHAGGEPVTTIFAPGCPGGTDEGGFGYTYALTEGTSIYGAGFVAEREPGDWSVGGSVTAAGNVGTIGWASVVLPFRGDGTRIAPPATPPGAPAGPPGSAPLQSQDTTPSPRSGRARLLTRSARVRDGRVAVRVGCSGGGECGGSMRVGRARPTVFSVPAGRTGSVRLVLPRALARRVQRRGRAVAQVAIGDERARLTLRR